MKGKHIKLNRRTAILYFFLPFITINAIAQEQEVNVYGLKTVSSLSTYQQLIDCDSSLQLVDLSKFIPGVLLDIKYAGAENLMKKPMYSKPAAYLSLDAAKALYKVQEHLNKMGYGLKIWDAYRPYSVTVAFYEQVQDATFAASPRNGSRHNRGCAIDLTLVHLKTGKELAMPTAFDDFSPKARTNYSKLPTNIIKNRALLKKVMHKYGFSNYAAEWWHYDFSGWEAHPVLDLPFEQL